MSEEIEAFRKRVQKYFQSDEMAKNIAGSSSTFDEFLTILEELRVADEELRQQNEELQISRGLLESERLRYLELFEFAPDAYLVTDTKGLIRQANRAAERLLNVEVANLIGHPLSAFVGRGSERKFSQVLNKLSQAEDIKLPIKPIKLPDVDTLIRVAPLSNPERTLELLWLVRDITEHKHNVESLIRSEERFRKIFHNATVGAAQLDGNGQVLETNHAMRAMLSIPEEKDSIRHLSDLIHPMDLPLFAAHLAGLFSRSETGFRSEVRLQNHNGNVVWGNASASLIHSGEAQPIALLMFEDISVQKHFISERIEMQRQILDGIEAERMNLARELHDNPMQDLYGVLYQLAEIGAGVNAETAEGIEQVQRQVQGVINTLRSTAGELRPPSLTHFGIDLAIRSYAESLHERFPNIHMNLELENGLRKLPERIEITLYRVFQQALANTVRHASATEVTVRLFNEEDQAKLFVTDNGVGFVMPENLFDLTARGHYGVAGIAERVLSVGGKWDIRSAPGEGTTISVAIPLRPRR